MKENLLNIFFGFKRIINNFFVKSSRSEIIFTYLHSIHSCAMQNLELQLPEVTSYFKNL